MATMDPTITPGSATTTTTTTAPVVGTGGAIDNETLQGNLAEGEARADATVSDLENYVSPTGSGDSHIGSISDRTGDMNSTTSI